MTGTPERPPRRGTTSTPPARIARGPRQTSPTLRLQLADHPATGRLDGGWWPRSRDVATEVLTLPSPPRSSTPTTSRSCTSARPGSSAPPPSRTNFISLLGHDVQNPLSSIVGFAELVADAVGHDHAARPALQAVQRAAERIRRIVREVLTLVALDGERLVARPVPTQLLPRVRAAVELVRTPAAVAVDCAADLAVLVQEVHLDQVLANLVVNAEKYAGGATAVTAAPLLDATGTPTAVQVHVDDLGPGVPADLVPTLFERFTRADQEGQALRPRALPEPGAGRGQRRRPHPRPPARWGVALHRHAPGLAARRRSRLTGRRSRPQPSCRSCSLTAARTWSTDRPGPCGSRRAAAWTSTTDRSIASRQA